MSKLGQVTKYNNYILTHILKNNLQSQSIMTGTKQSVLHNNIILSMHATSWVSQMEVWYVQTMTTLNKQDCSMDYDTYKWAIPVLHKPIKLCNSCRRASPWGSYITWKGIYDLSSMRY